MAIDETEKQLLDAYGAAVKHYCWIVEDINTKSGLLNIDEYRRISVFAEEAGMACDKAFDALNLHRGACGFAHGCL